MNMSSAQNCLLIVDDDREIRELLGDFLAPYGFEVLLAEDGEKMFKILQISRVDLIILDLMLPGEDGLSLCQKLRKQTNIPVIMLTAIGTETDRIIGLEMGADDYIAKPFNPREILARVKAVLRRSVAQEQDVEIDVPPLYDFEGWLLDPSKRKLLSPEALEVSITAGEYELLLAFLKNPQRVLSRDQLLEITKNRSAGPFDRSIDVQISRLRQKIEADPKNPDIIKTVRGGGYLFTVKVVKTNRVDKAVT